MNNCCYFICGPTAIGKSSLALRLAKKINGVIINADSMQVYGNLEILTARPSNNDTKKIKHRLYGFVEGSQRYNVALWCKDILQIIDKNMKKNIPSIIVGGTSMYIDSLINGIIDMPSINEDYKIKSQKLLEELGRENFIKLVKEIDYESFQVISLNDTVRLKRIWEVYNATGVTFSNWKKNKNKVFLKDNLFKIFLFTPIS